LSPALPVIVDLIDDDAPTFDVCIDDAFGSFLENDVQRGSAIIPFVLHLFGRQLNDGEPLARDDLISIKKMLAEGTPSEVLPVLGWLVDTRRMEIKLPPDKAGLWSTDIKDLIVAGSASKQELETLIGRLNHVGYIIPLARHYLNRLRSALTFAETNNRRRVKFTDLQHADLYQWLKFIHQAEEGINMNLVTYRQPSILFRSDACPFGIGGFSLTNGTGWRFELPPALQGRVSLNCLEYLAAFVAMLVEDHYHGIPPLSCLHSQVDSTSASGWLHKSNFAEDDDHATHVRISRDLTDFVMKSNICLTSQWFPGKENNVADSLSRDFHLSDETLTLLLQHVVPQQLPTSFVIKPLPKEIVSFIASVLLCSKQTTVLSETPTRSVTATGVAGKNFLAALGSSTTPSSPITPAINDTASLLPSPAPSEIEPSALTMAATLYQERSRPPWTTWQRCLGTTTNQTHGTMPLEKQRTFFNANVAATPTTTHPQNTRRPSPQDSSGSSMN